MSLEFFVVIMALTTVLNTLILVREKTVVKALVAIDIVEVSTFIVSIDDNTLLRYQILVIHRQLLDEFSYFI